MGDRLRVSTEVTNTGKRAGTETVQLYIQQLTGDVVRPVRELKAFKRVTLEPGQKQLVEFSISTNELSYHNQQMQLVTDAGKYKVWIGKNSAEGLDGNFVIR